MTRKSPERIGCILTGEPYKVGDPAPIGYMEWHEWAGVQHRGGLRQQRAPEDGKWRFPQELKETEHDNR